MKTRMCRICGLCPARQHHQVCRNQHCADIWRQHVTKKRSDLAAKDRHRTERLYRKYGSRLVAAEPGNEQLARVTKSEET